MQGTRIATGKLSQSKYFIETLLRLKRELRRVGQKKKKIYIEEKCTEHVATTKLRIHRKYFGINTLSQEPVLSKRVKIIQCACRQTLKKSFHFWSCAFAVKNFEK